MFFMPPYSPELNPEELLNQDIKSNAVGRKRTQNKKELEHNVRSYLMQRKRHPEIVKNYLCKQSVVYAA